MFALSLFVLIFVCLSTDIVDVSCPLVEVSNANHASFNGKVKDWSLYFVLNGALISNMDHHHLTYDAVSSHVESLSRGVTKNLTLNRMDKMPLCSETFESWDPQLSKHVYYLGGSYTGWTKKCIIRILSSNLFDFTFPHGFRNQNFEPVSSQSSPNVELMVCSGRHWLYWMVFFF